jgi:hypothetical protein
MSVNDWVLRRREERLGSGPVAIPSGAASHMPVRMLQPPAAMLDPPATRAEIKELIGDGRGAAGADMCSAVDRIAEIGASVDEIGEALDDLEGRRSPDPCEPPTSARVVAVRRILDELFAGDARGGMTFSMLGEPLGRG